MNYGASEKVRFTGGRTSVEKSFETQVEVEISGSKKEGEATVRVKFLGFRRPRGTKGPIDGAKHSFYDIKVTGANEGTAHITIREPTRLKRNYLQYWSDKEWKDAEKPMGGPGWVSGDISVSKLKWTPIVVGT